jgi:heme oxygenase (mycobilin-producing)
MIIRIVRMHFTDAGVAEFLAIFDRSKTAIRNFPGCTHLELLKDQDDACCYTTLSYWETKSNLDAYRKSALFEEVWGQVKSLFSERSQAFSLEKYLEV